MPSKQKKEVNNNMKLRIAETIGELKSKQMKINGQGGQVIIDASSLIRFLKEIQKLL